MNDEAGGHDERDSRDDELQNGQDPSAPVPQQLAGESTRGLLWIGTGRLLAQPVSLLSMIVLARVLTPDDFGLVSMCAVFIGLAAMGNEFGLMNALIQRQELTRDETDSVFWLNMAIGILFALLGALLAPLIARFYGEAQLQVIFPVLSLTFILTSLGLVQNALLRRQMDFRSVALSNTVAAVVAAVVSVVLSLAGLGVWSLVLGTLAGAATSSLFLAVRSRYVPRLHFRLAEARHFASFGAAMTVSDFSNYGTNQLDRLIIGRGLGTGSLGAYTIASNLAMFPATKISTAIAGVTLPAFAKIQGDLGRYSAAYRRATRLSAIVMLPPLATAAVLSRELVLGLYGPQWTEAVIPFAILCFAGMVRSVGVLTSVVFRGLGRPEVEMRWSLAAVALTAALALIGVNWGVVGVALGVTVAALAAWIPKQVAACGLLELKPTSLFRELGQPLAAAILASCLALLLGWGLRAADLPLIVIGLAAFAGAMLGTWIVTRSLGWFSSVREIEGLARTSLSARRKRTAQVTQDEEAGT